MNEWNFQIDKIIHVPCGKKAYRFYGTQGKICCNKCSKPLPEALESIADFVMDHDQIEPLEFYSFLEFYSLEFYSYGKLDI